MARTLLSLLLTLAVLPAFADSTGTAFAEQGIVVTRSSHSVTETLDNLQSIVKEKGFTVFARIDHAAGASKIGQTIRPNQVLLFGNPKIGTALMSSRASAGLDLPIRVVSWQDENDQVWIAYNAPAWIAQRHGITDREAVVQKMTGALGKLIGAAAQ